MTTLFFLMFPQANLRVVPWDGYLKYYNLGEKHPGLIEKRRRVRGRSSGQTYHLLKSSGSAQLAFA